MRKIFIYLFFVVVTSTAQSQNNEDYMLMMVKQKKAFRMATSEKDFQDLANNFERIANSQIDQWHPLYYAAFSYINKSFVGKDVVTKDVDLDKAQNFIDKALEIYPEESEIWVIQGLLFQGRIQIEPMKRGKEFSIKAGQALNKAKEFNSSNPRAYYLLGLNVLHSPKAFGGGAEAACPMFTKARDLFTKYVPDHVLSPTWGGEENDKLFNENCQKSK